MARGCDSSDGCASCLERHDREDHEDWFDRMVHRVGLSDAIGEVVTYISLGAMVVLALIVVLNELRAAGLLGRRARDRRRDAARRRSGDVASDPDGGRDRAGTARSNARACCSSSSPRSSPRSGACRPPARMTVRELSDAVNLEADQDRERLDTLAATAERARYAESAVPPEALESAYARGRELLDSVEKLREPEVPAGATS